MVAVKCSKDLSVVPLDQRWMFEESEVNGPVSFPPFLSICACTLLNLGLFFILVGFVLKAQIRI